MRRRCKACSGSLAKSQSNCVLNSCGKATGMAISGAVPSSRLHQGYPDTGILAETRCEHASGRPGPNDYVVKFLSCGHARTPKFLRMATPRREEKCSVSWATARTSSYRERK